MAQIVDVAEARDILRRIEDSYPKTSEKVALSFAREILGTLEHRSPPSERRRITPMLTGIWHSVRRGMKAIEFHNALESVLIRGDSGTMLHTPDSAISRLERQLRDLRTMVTSPSDIEKKFKDLQDQVEGIREDMEGDRSPMADKQEDMLQKFLAADKKAFIIMPFQRDFDDVWFGGIKPACLECHYAPLRVDEVNLSSLITDDIERYSNMADVAVVDLTGNNPNVMFELGWSLAKNKKPIVICQGEHTSKVAFDVRGIRHISYENSWLGIEALKKKLKDFITTTEKQTPGKKTKKTKKARNGTQPTTA